MIDPPATARIVQVSTKETITYDMSLATYELMCDVFDTWRLYYGRSDKPTVEKVLVMMEPFAPDVRKDIVVKRAPTKQEIRGLAATTVWYDELMESKDLT